MPTCQPSQRAKLGAIVPRRGGGSSGQSAECALSMPANVAIAASATRLRNRSACEKRLRHTNSRRTEDPQFKKSFTSRATCLKSGGDFAQRLDHVINDRFDQSSVIALTHHPDNRFRPRWTHDQASTAAQLPLGARDHRTHLVVIKWLALLVANILENLRQRFEPMTKLRHTLAAALDHCQQLQRGDQAVARGRVVRQNNMA